jgi:Zn-dependent protease
VALAGPASNFIVALVAAIAASAFPLRAFEKIDILRYFQLAAFQGGGWESLANNVAGSFSSILFALLLMIISWNVILGCFNLVPVPPLDGSKILFSLFRMRDETIALFEQYGFMMLLFIIVFFPYPISLFISRMLGIFFGIAA